MKYDTKVSCSTRIISIHHKGSARVTARFRFIALLMVVAMGASAYSARAQGQAVGTIVGRTTDRDGTPLSRATVTLDDGEQKTISSADGSFVFMNVPAGRHTLVVTYVAYAPFKATVSVQAGRTEQLNIVLDERPSGSSIIVDAPRIPYRPQASTTALKTSTPLLETPASVQIITAERLAEQRADRASDMFDYMTGVYQAGGQRAQDYIMRGLKVDDRFIPYQIDGISGGVWRQQEPPAAIIERIEYLKGPSSTLYGITQLGGLINYITKKPKASPEASIELRHTTYASDLSPAGAKNSANVTADFTGPVDDEGRFLYRLIANHINTTSYRNNVYSSSLDLMPELTWNASDVTQVTASLNVNIDKGIWDEFLPVPQRDFSKIPDLRVRVNEPNDYYWDYGWGLGYSARHVLNEDWVIRSVGRHTERYDGRKLFDFNGMKSDGVTMARRYRDQWNARFSSYADVTAEGRLSTGDIVHTLLFGATIGNELIHFDRRSLSGDSTLDVNIYDPVHGAKAPWPPKPGFDRHWNNLILTGYAQDQVALIKEVQFVAGVQYTREATHHENTRPEFVFDKQDAGFSPRVGLIVLPAPDLSIYGSFSTSFMPANAEQENEKGNLDFEPQIGQQIEAGVKFALLDNILGGTVAAYSLDMKNVLNQTQNLNPNGNFYYVQSGRSRSRGLEVELSLAPFQGFYATAGYAYTDARIVEDLNPSRVGQRLPYVPFNSFNVWATYRLPVAEVRGMKVGLGLVRLDDRPTEFPTSAGMILFLPTFTRVDGLVSYDFSRATLAVNVSNLFDERYYTSGGVSRIIPGAPRSIRTSLQVRM